MLPTSKSVFVKRAPRELAWLAPMFRELRFVIDEFIDWHDDPPKNTGEPPYWNNETASVSMLIAAAARKGYMSLADYHTNRRGGSKGRCDLYLARGKNWLEIEAKQVYIREESGKPSSINRALDLAAKQARSIPTKEPCAGLVFAVMSVPAEERLNWEPVVFKTLFKEVECDLCWIWYDADVDDRYREGNSERAWPGIGIFLRSLRR